MLTFEVQVNDETPVRAGAKNAAVLAATVTYVEAHKDLELRVGGMTRDSGSASHVEWVERKLSAGDVVVLRVMNFVQGNSPIRVKHVDPQEDDRQLREYYETLKKRFEPPSGTVD